jgi:hypothetical protein
MSRLSFIYQKQEREMLALNEQRSGVQRGGVGESKFIVVLESDSMDEVNSAEAKRMALDVASQHGWGNAGLADNPIIGAVDTETDEVINSLDPKVQIKCYRAEFTIAKRL